MIILRSFDNCHSYFFFDNDIWNLTKFSNWRKGDLKKLFFIVIMLCFACSAKTQLINCTFDKPVITIHFGSGDIHDLNTSSLVNYDRVGSYCPTDGHYTYTSYTSDCFRGDWWRVTEDHTPGDVDGNMMLVNSSYRTGSFFTTTLEGLKGGATYEFSVWIMNVCKPSDKCPYPLLPNLSFRLQTLSGNFMAQFGTGEVSRRESPQWTQFRAPFKLPASETTLLLTMVNSAPGGCGNDFALDDIVIRECIKKPPVSSVTPKQSAAAKKQPVTVKQAPKKSTPPPEAKEVQSKPKDKPQSSTANLNPVKIERSKVLPPPPPVLTTRTNSLVKTIETGAGQVTLNLYDNGEIDGDTVSIYHNNKLVVSRARLSQKPITVNIDVNAEEPHHEVVMVAENLGSIPPNTSVMIVTAGSKRYQVYISSTEQKNAKVVFDLKE